MLVAYDQSKPGARGGFLVPVLDGNTPQFFNLRTLKPSELGTVVFTGRGVTVNDVAARLVDSGRRIENVRQTLAAIEAYLAMLQDFHIGNIVGVEHSNNNPCGFKLRPVAKMPAITKINLP